MNGSSDRTPNGKGTNGAKSFTSFREISDFLRQNAEPIDRLREYRQALITAAVAGNLELTATARDDDATLEQVEGTL